MTSTEEIDVTDYTLYESRYYKIILGSKININTDKQLCLYNNYILIRKILEKNLKLLTKRKRKNKNEYDYIPIINPDFTEINFKPHNKAVFYDYMMSYNENKLLCWYIYCIIINMYDRIDSLNIQGGFFRDCFEKTQQSKNYIDIDIYLSLSDLKTQKLFINNDNKLSFSNGSCWINFPDYLNSFDSIIMGLLFFFKIKYKCNFKIDIIKLSYHSRIELPKYSEYYSITITYKIIYGDTFFILNLDVNPIMYASLSNDIYHPRLKAYSNYIRINNIANYDYLGNTITGKQNKKTKNIELQLAIPTEKLNSTTVEILNLFNIIKIIKLILRDTPISNNNYIINIVKSFLSESDQTLLITYFSIYNGIMIPCHAMCNNFIELNLMRNNIIHRVCKNINRRANKFKLKKYRIINIKCHCKICIHQEETITVQEILEFSNYIKTIQN
uniref:Uncharacterized protein n=1 Tax=viral metagenome TaxID=1070528 RepID=A0A6C0H8J3_9ZZZZ